MTNTPKDAADIAVRLRRLTGLNPTQIGSLSLTLDPVQVDQINDSDLASLVNGTLPGLPLNASGGLPLGLPGATQGARFAGGTVSGAPTTGTFQRRDWVVDGTGTFYVCTVAGSPGTWVQVSGGGGTSLPTQAGNAGKVLGTDGTNASWVAGGGGGAVSSVAGKTGAVSLVKADVGLGNVDNTADSAKPVSTAQATAIAGVLPVQTGQAGKILSTDGSVVSWTAAGSGGAVSSVAGKTGAVSLVKADVGLGNVDNTSDAAKQTANDARYVQTSQVAPLSNSIPQTASTSAGSAGTASEAMRADAVILLPAGIGATQWWGDGSDGTATLDGTATVAWASKSGSVYTVTTPVYADALTVASGATLRLLAPLYCKTSLTVASGGVVHNDGFSASGATAGTFTDGNSWPRSTAGGAGGTGVGVTQSGNGSYHQGGGGGAGGTGTAGAGGAQQFGNTYNAALGGRSPLRGAPTAFSLNAYVNPTSGALSALGGGLGGSSGAGDSTNAGGGGGGGAGVLLINAKTVVNNGTIRANGGNGGTPSTGNCGGGGSGGGGVVVCNATSYTGSGVYQVNPGTPGSGVGTGTAGTVGTSGSPNGSGFLLRNTW